MRETKTFRCTLNRTILSKTQSHGTFISSKEVVMGLLGITEADLVGLARSAELGVCKFYLRNEYYSMDDPTEYSMRMVKAGAELRITQFSRAFNDLGITETDELLLEKIDDNGEIVYLIDKVSKPNVVIVEKYNPNNYNTLVYDQIDLIEKRIISKSVNLVSSMVTQHTDSSGTVSYSIDVEGKKILEALTINSFKELHPILDVDKLNELEELYNKLREYISSGLVKTDIDDDGDEVYTISQEVKDLLDNIAEIKFGEKKDGGLLNLITPYWVWDNSYGVEIWPELLDKRMPGHFQDDHGNDIKVEIIIRRVGIAEIPCASNFQSKSIYSISIYDGESEIVPTDTIYSIERKGNQIIMMQKGKVITSSDFSTSI